MALNLPLQYEKDLEGQDPTYYPADASGHTFPNAGNVAIYVKNDGGAAVTLTAVTARPCSFGTHPDETINCPAFRIEKTKTFHAARFTDVGTGLMTITLSATGGISVAAVVQQQILKGA